MITQASEWVFEIVRHEPGSLTRFQKRHVLFPAIVPGQFIPGSPEYIPIRHDGIPIDDEFDDNAAEPLN
ncbi:ZYBA0S12-01882g1_1 [Zygosaccharomyces bailii CLIB 213]|uniref:ZYBA0S12-01882g1_1 n=1 Tax=Zygosaccharomyces bailii (strain CLIB 213 / ATCC 58445 / CBS 680 / BCRC 21525 / NBRC 1098 / NCYC 1416 / NRRL Y-2227) TaxID=1333698 RepID=A0A8J2T9V6_ZYGB2|nr:ZYBA0S12-01882g1_1 [Zygosaccharomyces bailii CLIB 213]